MTAGTATVPRFASLAELQENHAALARGVGKDVRAPANLERIGRFVRKAVATGEVLDAPADRDAAQSLISFWTARLASAARELEKKKSPVQVPVFDDTLLAEFNSDALVAAVITPTDRWLDQQSLTDQALARRLVLRLLTLREDGNFEVVLGASGVSEDLEPQDRAQEILDELVRLGVVRSTRNPSGYEEYALESPELLNRWPRLQGWMDERKRFRQKATQWARRRAAKAAAPSGWSFMRRMGKAFEAAFHKVIDWIDVRRRSLLASLRIGGAAEEFLSEEEYDEAETYRDKNAAELRLVYQRRLHERERQERRKVQAVVVSVVAFAFAVLSVVAIRGWLAEGRAKIQALKAEANATSGWRAEGEAKTRAEKAEAEAAEAKNLANLHVADLYYEKSAQHEADDWDASGAFLWYAAAWSKFKESADALDLNSEERERLRTSYLVQLATARERLPFLSGLAYHKELLASDRTPDGRFLVTVGVDVAGPTSSPVVLFWRWSNRRGRPDWEPSRLAWAPASPRPAFGQAVAYVSPNGRFAVVSGGATNTASAIYAWNIPEAGPERFVGELKGHEGNVMSAGFSPDNQLFAVVGQLKDKGKVTCWRSESWDTPIDLPVPDGIGQLGQLAFCPTTASNRLAVAVAPGPPTSGAVQSVNARSGNDRVICLEWSLNDSRAIPPPRNYASSQRFPWVSPQAEIQTFVTYKPDGSELLVSNSFQNGPWANVWLFDSSKKDPNPDAPTPSFQLLSPAPVGLVLHAAFSHWDDRLLIAGGSGKAELWGAEPGGQRNKQYRRLRSFEHKAQIFKADFSPDGQYIVTASRDYRALIWHADSGRLAHPSFYHSGSVTDAGFTEDGRSLITSSWDTIQRWDLTRGESRPLPVGTSAGVRATSADPDGKWIVTAGQRESRTEQLGSAGWARVWDTVTGDPRTPELCHPAPVVHAAIGGPGRELVSTVTIEGEVRLWSTTSGRELWAEKPKEGAAMYTAFGRARGQDHLLALIHGDPRRLPTTSHLRIYPLNTSGARTDAVRTFSYPATFTTAVFGPECKHVVAYTGGGVNSPGTAVVWDVQSGKQSVLKGSGRAGTAHDESITHAAFSSDGAYLVTTGRDDKAFVWDLSDGSYSELLTQRDEEIGHTADIEFASFDRAGNRVATAGADGRAIIWERNPGQRQFHAIQKFKNDRALTHVVFSTHERYVLTADTDGTTRLFDIKDRRPLVTKSNPGQSILQIVFREDKDRHTRVYLIANQAGKGPAFSNRLSQSLNFPVAGPPGERACPVVTEWRLTRSAAPEEEYGPLAQWTASRKLDVTPFRTELSSLPQDSIFRLWKETAPRADLAGPLPGVEVSLWHEREAALCELEERWRPAIDHWTRALVKPSFERRPILLARRARVYSELKDWDRAERDLDGAIHCHIALILAGLRGSSADSEVWQARADARFQQSQQGKDRNKLMLAIGDYRRAVQANQDNGTARAQLADAFVMSGQFKEALAEYNRTVERDRKNPDLLLKRAQAFLKSNDRLFDRAYADYLVAGHLFRDRQRLDDADKAYSGAVVLFKEGVEPSGQRQAKVHAELAEVLERRASLPVNVSQSRNIYGVAFKHFSEAIKLDDTVWTYWSGIARCHERLGEWKEASHAFQEALKRNPGDPGLAFSAVRSLVQVKDWDAAAKAYSAIIRSQPKELWHRLRLAEIYLQPIPSEKEVSAERLEQARLCLAEAVKDELLAKQSSLWSYLAVIEVAAGKLDDYRTTRARMFEVFKNPMGNDANNVAWVAALMKDTPAVAERAIALARSAVSAFPKNVGYLNTYGAALCRAAKRDEAIKALTAATDERALALYLSPDQRAYGDAMDKLFIAMAQYIPEQPGPARQTLKLALQTIDRVKPAQQSETPEQSLARVLQRLEFEVIRREAERLINP
jgi:WD40 repeat protein/tetratricopeptide (TPR) repeat protein